MEENVGTVVGIRYEGEWQHGKPHGQGTKVWASGSRYEGEYQHGMKHVQGTFVWANGNRDEGEYQNNKLWNGTIYRSSGGPCEIRNGQQMC